MGMDTLLPCRFVFRLFDMHLHGVLGEDDRSAVVRVHAYQHIRIHGHCRRSCTQHIGHSRITTQSDEDCSNGLQAWYAAMANP